MKIDCHNGWFKGLGDIVCFAWIGAGLISAGHQDIHFFAHGWRADLLKMFEMPVTNDPRGAIVCHDGYEQAVAENSSLNYCEWIAFHHGIDLEKYPIVRPRLDIIPMDREMGRLAAAPVLIFPHCVWAPRTWPKNYFVELGLLLKSAGIRFACVTEERDSSFQMFPCIYGQTLGFVSAAIQKAQLVIGNDSGPAHLAGTIGTKTLTIHGPTRSERIYGYLRENMTGLRMNRIGCSGCHCLKPYRASCELGCHELYRTTPEDVFNQAIKMIS